MLSLSRLSLATLLLALPVIHAQGPPAAGGGGGGPGGPAPAGSHGPDNLPTAEDKAGDESMAGYPEWVTNDYPCVIDCCQGFNGDISRDRNPDLEGTTRQCVIDKCSKNTEAMNLYQMTYIIEMFYQTGSIYECDGRPCWPDGQEPAPGQDGTAANGTASGTGEHSATPAVSIPAVSNASSGAGEPSTTVQSVTASDGSVTVETSVTPADEQARGEGENGAAKSGHGIGLAIAAVGLAMGAGGVL